MKRLLVSLLLGLTLLVGAACSSESSGDPRFPIYCNDGSTKQIDNPQRCESVACPETHSCGTAASGEMICIPDDICGPTGGW